MQFIDLKGQFGRLERKIRDRIDQVLAHGHYILGPEVAEFEGLLAEYCRVSHAIGCANGTDALVMALRALDIGPGDAVLTTPFSFFATVEAIMLVGARPVFADIDASTFNIDPERLSAAIEGHDQAAGRLRAVITVDLFGLPADYTSIEPLCRDHGLSLIETRSPSASESASRSSGVTLRNWASASPDFRASSAGLPVAKRAL